MKTSKINQEQKDAIKYLKSIIKPDSELLVNIHHVSASGMLRKMSVYVVGNVDCWVTDKEGKNARKKRKDLIKLNYWLQKAGIEKMNKTGSIDVTGCGMDMAFHLTYGIKCELFGSKSGLNNQQYRVI